MHRHGYQGRKLHRDRAQRTSLFRGLAGSLVEHGKIETTLPKAKELVPYIEKLITKAKKGDLSARRQVLAAITPSIAAHKLVDEIAPQLNTRNSGHVRIERTRLRVGDNAQLASVSFVDELKASPEESKIAATKPIKKAPVKAKAGVKE